MSNWVAVPYVLGLCVIAQESGDIVSLLKPLKNETLQKIAYVLKMKTGACISLDCSLLPINRYMNEQGIEENHVGCAIKVMMKENNFAETVDLGLRNVIGLSKLAKVTPFILVVSVIGFYNARSINVDSINISEKNRRQIESYLQEDLCLSKSAVIKLSSHLYHKHRLEALYYESISYLEPELKRLEGIKYRFSDFPQRHWCGPLLFSLP